MKRSVALLPLGLAACVPASRPPEPPAPPPPRVAAPAPPPVPALGPDWRDWPLTPGAWRYRRDTGGALAQFGEPGAEARLTLRCDAVGRRVELSVAGDAGPATLRTSSATRQLALQAASGVQSKAAAALASTDPLLDAIAFSRGRFTVERAGSPPLVVPTHAEVARVTEDCRP